MGQETVSTEASGVVEVAASQTVDPVVIADPTDAGTTQAAVISILGLLRAQGVTVAS